jgi:hypothetical protein
MELRQKIESYFKLTEEEKGLVLVEIIEIYKTQSIREYQSKISIKQLIDIDIVMYTDEEEFELVQALTDIRNAINEVEEEIKKIHGL